MTFFFALLPYIEQNNLYTTPTATTPVKTYIAPSDPYNPGTSGLISYASNANLLNGDAVPTATSPPARLPSSFLGRTSSTIVVMERTGKTGATWLTTTVDTVGPTDFLFDASAVGSAGPTGSGTTSFPEFTTQPVALPGYNGGATALTSALGCTVGMGDGSARVVTNGNATSAWAWAINPQNAAPQPSGW